LRAFEMGVSPSRSFALGLAPAESSNSTISTISFHYKLSRPLACIFESIQAISIQYDENNSVAVFDPTAFCIHLCSSLQQYCSICGTNNLA
jgi:hypothetical protein